ncbi:hypothetical protein [Streptosporangium canum]|uniref:hypothetical protein n=1 Tax=Streptosporangium canum TaxID=324952 RepID=UPI00341D67A7
MGEIKRSTQKKRSWDAWSGEIADLRRIGRTVEELHDARVSVTKTQAEEARREYEASQGEISGVTISGVVYGGVTQIIDYSYSGNRVLEDISSYPFVGLVLLDDEDKVVGSIDDIFPEIDRRSMERLTFISAINPREHLIVTFARDSAAATVDIESEDTGWARQALARITDEVEKGVPRWAFVRGSGSTPFWINVGVATVVGLATGLAQIAQSVSANFAIGLMVFVGIFIFLFSSMGLRDFVFPRFEVLGDGAQSTGSRRLVTLTLIAISIPIGVFVNLIS